jgi:hypothetical protein
MKLLLILSFLFLQCPGFAQDAEEMDSEKVLKERQEKARIQSIAESTATAAVEFDLERKLKESSIFDKQVQAMLSKSFKDAKLWEVSPEELRKKIQDGAKGKSAEKIFKAFPKLLDLATNMFKDKDAFPGLIKILGRTDALKQYFFIWLFLMITGWLVKKYLFPEEPNFWRRTFTKLIFSGFISAVSLGVFYGYFHVELSPTMSVLSHTFWSSGS